VLHAASLSLQDWAEIGQIVLALGVVAGGAWAVYSHWRTQRREAARLLHGALREFYLGGKFDRVRRLVEYDYVDALGPLLDRRVDDRRSAVTEEEKHLLQDLDALLTYFEHILYLEEERQITRKDRQSVFRYWFDTVGHRDRASLLRYVQHFGWTRVTRALRDARSRDAPVGGEVGL
jgi:hypothetical protein